MCSDCFGLGVTFQVAKQVYQAWKHLKRSELVFP